MSLKKILTYLRNSYKLDLRALALMRIGISLVVIVDLITRATAMEAHYTADGVLPIKLLMEFDPKPLRWSFHYLSDTFTYQSFLFLVHGVVMLALLLGYRTRVFSILAWVFIVSLQNRNPFIQQGGDDLLRLTLFWGMFLPWGIYYSFDSKKSQDIRPKYTFSAGTMAYLLLVCSVYLFSAIYKTSPEWRTEGTALYYALSLDQIKVGLGDFVYQFPGLMKFLTFFVYYGLEIAAPLLVLIPFGNQRLRTIGAVGIMLLHIGIALHLYVGLFYVIGIASTLGMLPTKWMDRLDEKIGKTKQKLSGGYFKTNVSIYLIQLRNILALVVMSLSLVMSFSYCRWFPYQLNQNMILMSNALKLEQFWGMFSPYIYKDDGWFIYKGYTESGGIWDIYNDKPELDETKPKDIDKMYPTDRWRKFAENYQRNNYNFMRPYYCRYLIRKWNEQHPANRIKELTIFFLKEESLPNYETKAIERQNVCMCSADK
jgi:hypothetical protein